jgi:hypothetical protein
MAKMRWAVLALVGVALGCNPDVPANPTYTKDVQPIFMAHCVRCHGANDMLNTMTINGSPRSPLRCYLQRYEDEGACSGVTDCMFGAGSAIACTNQYISYITRTDTGRMPPPPSEPLNDWEKDVIILWVHTGAPK